MALDPFNPADFESKDTTVRPNGQPLPLSEWGIPVSNNHDSSCRTTRLGENNMLFLLLFLHFGNGGPTVGNNRHGAHRPPKGTSACLEIKWELMDKEKKRKD